MKGSSHVGVYGRLSVPCRELWPGVVTALVVVVLHVQVDQLGVVDAERTARVVDVLTIQGLRNNGTDPVGVNLPYLMIIVPEIFTEQQLYKCTLFAHKRVMK